MEKYFLLFTGAVIFLGIIEIYLILRRRKKLSTKDLFLISNEWKDICKRVSYEPRHVVCDADKLLDFVLKKKGYVGSMGDKLKKSDKLFSHINDVWSVHKLRNKYVHEIGIKVTKEEAKHALSIIRQALWDMGIKV